MKVLRIAMMVATLTAAAAQGWAGETAKDQAADLTEAKEKLAQRSLTTTGGPRQELWMEQRKVQNLIDDLQGGRRVSPAEIDRVLQDAERDAR